MATEIIDQRYQNYQRPDSLQKRLDNMKHVSPRFEAKDFNVAIVKGEWHTYIVDKLLEGAIDACNEHGINDQSIDIVHAPGAYEIPLVCQMLARTKKYGAIVTLGAVIKGDTPHFDFVAGECARGLSEVSREYELPIGFGVLTVNTVDQAVARAQEGEANKGREAVLAALQVVGLYNAIRASN